MANSKEWWLKYQEALRQGDKEAAAEYFRRYLEAKRAEGAGGSKPTLVSLSTRATDYPKAIPVEDIPKVMLEKPQFFDLLRRMGKKP